MATIGKKEESYHVACDTGFYFKKVGDRDRKSEIQTFLHVTESLPQNEKWKECWRQLSIGDTV